VNKNDDEKVLDTYRALLLMAEIGKDESLSQRELARRVGIALGLVNSYLKNLVAKGFVRVKNFPKNRYSYLLTPKGVAEKSRLAYQHLSYFTNLYTIARQDYVKLFKGLAAKGVEKVVFCGVDEVTEIAWFSLQGTESSWPLPWMTSRGGEVFREAGADLVERAAGGALPDSHHVPEERGALREQCCGWGCRPRRSSPSAG